MKKLYLFSFLCLFSNASSQIVNIPDANFKAYLVGNSAINTNADAEIQVSEAIAFTGTINCNSQAISNLTGIEAFINITKLFCSTNQLTSLNVSQNVLLNELRCGSNQLTSLDLSQNINLVNLNCSINQITTLDLNQNSLLQTLNCSSNQLASLNVTQNANLETLLCGVNQLTVLDLTQNSQLKNLQCNNNLLSSLNVSQNSLLFLLICRNNQLTQLDVSNNPALLSLTCHTNQLSALDVSTNTLLNELYCSNNQLTSLNVQNGNNTNFSSFICQNTPNLTCILVDDATYSTSNWTNVDPASTFVNNQTECNLLSNEDFDRNNFFNVYPNPTTSNITISSKLAIDKIEVFNLLGEKVMERNETTLDVKILKTGVYVLKIFAKNKVSVKRFIKE